MCTFKLFLWLFSCFQTYVLFCEYWYRWGRLDNFVQVLGCHPEFLEPFIKLHQCLFTGDLCLPYPVRYYLAILVSSNLFFKASPCMSSTKCHFYVFAVLLRVYFVHFTQKAASISIV